MGYVERGSRIKTNAIRPPLTLRVSVLTQHTSNTTKPHLIDTNEGKYIFMKHRSKQEMLSLLFQVIITGNLK